MTREELAAVVAEHAGSDLAARLVMHAADEYAARMVELHARTPQWIRDDEKRRARAEVAEQIARSIEALAVAPTDTTADEIRCLQVREDAATARRIGHAQHLEQAS